MKHTKKWILFHAIAWLIIGIGFIGGAVYQYIALEELIVSVGYVLGGGCCLIPSIIMFLQYHREEEIELEAYSRLFDEEVAKTQEEIREDYLLGSKYKTLMKVLLNETFTNEADEPDYDLMEQIILRYGYSSGYVELNESKDFVLSKKGKRLLGDDEK